MPTNLAGRVSGELRGMLLTRGRTRADLIRMVNSRHQADRIWHGANLRLSTVEALADVLDCDVEVTLSDRQLYRQP